MRESSLIIMYSGKTKWVNWELRKVIEIGQLPNLIMMIPEVKIWFLPRRSKDISTRIERIKEAFKNTKWSGSLEKLHGLRHIRAMLFSKDGTIIVIRSWHRNRDSYHLAALIAHYTIIKQTEAGYMHLEKSAGAHCSH
jgi:hypothetical protein